MNWKEEAAEKLRNYEAMRQAVANLPVEIKRLRIAAKSIRGVNLQAVAAGTGYTRKDEAYLNNLARREELALLLDQAKCWLQITDRALNILTNEERQILYRLYMYPQKGALNALCSELGVEHSSIYRKRDKALQRFTVALYGTDGQAS